MCVNICATKHEEVKQSCPLIMVGGVGYLIVFAVGCLTVLKDSSALKAERESFCPEGRETLLLLLKLTESRNNAAA